MKTIVNYELALKLKQKGYPQRNSEFYYFDNRAWNKDKPIEIMNREDASYNEGKGCFLDFEDTIAAPTNEEALEFLSKL